MWFEERNSKTESMPLLRTTSRRHISICYELSADANLYMNWTAVDGTIWSGSDGKLTYEKRES
jgi:hypothetical protein